MLMLELERRTFQSTMNQEKKREGINLCKDEAKRGTVFFFIITSSHVFVELNEARKTKNTVTTPGFFNFPILFLSWT